LDSSKLENVEILETLESANLSSNCSFITLQLQMIIHHFHNTIDMATMSPGVAWEQYLSGVFHGAINQKIDLSICRPRHLSLLMRKSSIVKNAFREQIGARNENFTTFLGDLAANGESGSTTQSEISFYLSILDNDENIDAEIVGHVFKLKNIPPIRKLVRLLRQNVPKWTPVVQQAIDKIQLKGVKNQVAKIFEIETPISETFEEISNKIVKNSKQIEMRKKLQKTVTTLEGLSSIEEISVSQNGQNSPSNAQYIFDLIDDLENALETNSKFEKSAKIRTQTNLIFECLKLDISQYDKIYTRLIPVLGKCFLPNPPEMTTEITSGLISLILKSNPLTPEYQNLARILSLLSYTPEHIEFFRSPTELSGLDRAEELEDMEILKEVLVRFKLFGFGNRKCFLSLWTSLQQLICSFTTTSGSSLSMGSGREDEIDVLCGAVQGRV